MKERQQKKKKEEEGTERNETKRNRNGLLNKQPVCLCINAINTKVIILSCFFSLFQSSSVFFSLLARFFIFKKKKKKKENQQQYYIQNKTKKNKKERKKERKKQYNQTRLALLCLALLEVGWVLITLLCVRIHCICNVVERLVRSKYLIYTC
jgi:flagellar biosynthesis component FlhA